MELKIPEITVLPQVDAFLSILLSDIRYNKGIPENFIGCYADGYVWCDYSNCLDYQEYAVLKGQLISSDIFKITNLHFADFIRDALESGYYVMAIIDTFYFNPYVSYEKWHINHPLLLTGYQHDTLSFRCRDYFDFGFYTEKEISCS